MALCYFPFFLIFLSYGSDADLAYSQTQFQNLQKEKHVLILNPFESNVPGFEKTNQGLSAALQSGGIGIRNQFYEHLNLRHNPGPEHKKLIVELIHRRYDRRRIDGIITLYPEALRFLLEEGQAIFPDTPVLALYLPQGFELPNTGRTIISHEVMPEFKRTLEIALKLVPKAERVYVVSGVHPVDRWLEDKARRDFQKWEGRLEFRYLNDMPLEEILTAVSGAPSGSIVYLINFSTDVTGKSLTTPEVSRQLARVSKAPVFGFISTLLGNGIVGGSLVNMEYIGTRAGELVLDLLRGTRYAENIPVVIEVLQSDMFDWRQLTHWKLSESALPRGSVIVNKEFSLWDFRYYIIGALSLILAQSFLIFLLFMHRRRRRSAEESLLKKTEELNQFFNISLDLLCIANTDGYFLRLNSAWERTFGHNRKELMAGRFFDFVHRDDLGRTQEALSALASQREVIYFENRYRCKDGTYRWLEWTAAPAGDRIYAVARDVTEHKLAEEALQERLRFEHLVSDLSARFVNISHDRVDAEIEYGLNQVLELFQVDRVALVRTLPGKSAYQITHVAYGEDIPPIPAGTELPISINPWGYEKLILKREVVVYSRLDDLPPEASVDKQTWAEWGIKSTLNIPILVGEPVDHVFAINSVKRERVWPEEFFPRLQILGEIFVNALERRQAEEASRESERILRQNENDLRRLAGRLISAQEEERSRLARELHDDLAQRLAVFAIDVGQLGQQLGNLPDPVQEALREMKKDIVTISQDVHKLSRQIHPSILDDLGLIKAVESECTNFSRREGTEIEFYHEKIPTVIPKGISLSLYRIIQEGLSNISKHACANHISVSMKGTGHDVLLSVQDDGIGFDPEEVREKPGLGFSSMRERVSLIHGEFSISSEPERGTVITVRVPLTRREE
jgi:PAS domain S-box-containing protein